jgi:hypothetical protein
MKESSVPVSDSDFQALADPPVRLEEIGREITARIDKLEKLTAKGVDHVDSIEQLLAEAEKLCGTSEAFEAFKRQHCPKLGKSRAYELLAIKEGRKSVEDSRAATRARVSKHRAAKRAVTESDSVTSDPQTKGVVPSTPINEPEAREVSAEERKAEYAATDQQGPVAEPDALKADADAREAGAVELEQKAELVDDPLVTKTGKKPWEIKATPWFESKIRPIFEGAIKNDPAKSASAITQFKHACKTLLPQMTPEDLEGSENILIAVGYIKEDVDDAIEKAAAAAARARRIKRESKNPGQAKEKAREKAQEEAMADDYEEAKAEARESGEVWSDTKDEWIEDWIANNWDEQAEADFEREFQAQWEEDHGEAWNGAPSAEVGKAAA